MSVFVSMLYLTRAAMIWQQHLEHTCA